MKITKIVLASLLSAGSLQASIIVSQGASPATYTSGAFSQNFSTAPTTSLNSPTGFNTYTTTGTTGSETISLETASNTALYYDPNGSTSGACNIGNGTGSGSLAGMVGCEGTYSLSQPGNGATNQGTYVPYSPTTQTFSILFGTPVYQTSFILATPAAVNFVNNTQITAYDVNNGVSNTEIATTLGAGTEYVTIQSTVALTEITFTEDTTNMSKNWNAVVSNITGTTTPEPASMGLLGLGLAGIGYIARRRKA